jgi:hypothetical protein
MTRTARPAARLTFAQRYNAECQRLMPGNADSLQVDPSIDCPNEIDEIVFRRSEYLGGMANVICALIQRQA